MRNRTLWIALVVAVAAATTGFVVATTTGISEEPADPTPSARPAPTSSSPPAWNIAPTEQATVARPTRVRIPAIGVDSRIIDITINVAGQLVPPATTDVVGWYTGGPAPGDTGPALLAAHVDSRNGPGVFYHLADLHEGDKISIDRADHTTVRFRVTSVGRVAKADFPTSSVYAPEPVPLLRLITCGGTFDRSIRSYRDNIIIESVPDP